jgi:hypothetical protein
MKKTDILYHEDVLGNVPIVPAAYRPNKASSNA